MIPSIGRVVHYRLSNEDVAAVNWSISEDGPERGNVAKIGDVLPAIIVRSFGKPDDLTPADAVNLQVLADGNFSLWLTSRYQGDDAGQWFEPPRVG